MALIITLWDLAIWFAGSSIVMLVASEMFAPFYGRKTLLLDLKKIRMVGIVFALAFIFTVGIRILNLASG
jgi:hypothetical protein